MNEEAAVAMHDADYHRGMTRYGEQMKRLTDPIWRGDYLERMKKGA